MRIPAPYIMPWLVRLGQRRWPQALWNGNSSRPQIALTFDDGPSRFTPALLAVLAEENVCATFFVLGDRAQKYPELVRQMHDAGHLLALHGNRHQAWTRLTASALTEDLDRCAKSVRRALGDDVFTFEYCRPPYGRCNRRVLDVVAQNGLRAVMLNIMPGEQLLPAGWRELPARTLRRVLREARPGAIVALHDGERGAASDGVYDNPHAAENARAIIRALRARGYEFVTVEAFDLQSPR